MILRISTFVSNSDSCNMKFECLEKQIWEKSTFPKCFVDLCLLIFLLDLNMSLHKQTLKANNKALAQNLAKTRLELRQLGHNYQELQAQNQELKVEVNRLRRIAGKKDGEIEEEVQRRIKVTFLLGALWSVLIDL